MTLWLKLIKNDNYTCMKKKKKDVIIWEIKYLEHLVSCCLPWWRDCHLQWAILPVFGSQGWILGLFWSQQWKTRQGFRPNSSPWLIGAQGKSSWLMLAGFGLWLRSSLTWQLDGMKHHRRLWSSSQPKQKPSLLPRPLKGGPDLLPSPPLS